jgi:hypothetical protein
VAAERSFSSSSSRFPWIGWDGVAHPKAQEGGGGPGGFRGAGPLGSDLDLAPPLPHPQSPDGRYLALDEPKKKRALEDRDRKEGLSQAKGPAPAAKPQRVTLTLIGDFTNPWSPGQEIAMMQAKKWHPSSDDFQAVSGSGVVVGSIGAFLAVIKQQAPGSIQRINLFSHTNRSVMTFGGAVNAVTGDVTLNVNAPGQEPVAMDGSVLKNPDPASFGGIARSLRDRFTQDAQMVFYMCSGGMDVALLKDIADTFRVKAAGFRNALFYCPEFTNPPPAIDRNWTAYPSAGAANPCEGKQRGFQHLRPDSVASPAP